MQLLAELRRRNVIRMAGLYLVGAWVIVQVAETVLPIFGVPDWVLRALIILLALGFVPALVFSWLYELTPDGLRRDSGLAMESSIATQTGRRMDRLIFAGLIVLIALIAADRYWPGAAGTGPGSLAAPTELAIKQGLPAVSEPDPVPANAPDPASIAVLPFADLSQAGDQGYFSDGMAEEILNVLAKVEGLQVASRTSAFAFKGQETLGVPAIAGQLGVRHVLEGSVRRAGDTLRITAQLIDAQTDRHLWSETFDRPLTAENVFAIQDEISRAIVAALVEALPSADVGTVGKAQTAANLGAYDNYLRARDIVRSRRQLRLAEDLLATSLQEDPQYAPAWELRAGLQLLLAEYTDFPLALEELERRGVEYADRALSLAPDSALAIAVKANIRSRASQAGRARADLAEVIRDLEHSLAIDPDSTNAMNWLGLTWAHVGHPDKALEIFQRCVRTDPRAAACSENEYDSLYGLGRVDEAWQRYLDALDRGATTNLWTHFPMLARRGEKAAFLFASNQSNFLPGWHRHEALYEAHRNLDADHRELLAEIRAFAEQEGIDLDNGYVTLLLTPLGAHDLTPFMSMAQGPAYRRYRQSPEFKRLVRESGVHDYWLSAGFPGMCQPVEPDDFRCD